MAEKGMVILVGAGPGDPGLFTLAGKSALESADVILHDRLVDNGILAMMPDSTLKVDVGKNKGDHPVPQDEINRLIVRHALEGKTVVRLKGGDPYLFGRGGEELEAVAEKGIPFRVIPGVSSAIAAPACVGIPVTHRNHSSSVHILTGHGKEGNPPRIPYPELARLDGTLVFLMAVAAIEEICSNLVEAGLPATTPAALVENGSRANQRRLSATLATLPKLAEESAFSSPSVLIVGSVVDLAPILDWTAALPLRGRRVLTVSSMRTGSRLAALLREQGCTVDEFAGITTERIPLPDAFWKSIDQYTWIVLTSRFGVECFFDGLLEVGLDVRTLAGHRFAVAGGQTGQALEQRGIRPDFVPSEFNGLALGRGLCAQSKPRDRLLLFRAESGSEELPETLRRCGIHFDDFDAYMTHKNTLAQPILDMLRSGGYDAITFTSASSVEAFTSAFDAGEDFPPAFCIGAMTARAAEQYGMRVTVGAEATIDSMASAIVGKMGKS